MFDLSTIIYLYIAAVIFIVVIIVSAIGAILRMRKNGRPAADNGRWYLKASLSREDGLGQCFLVLGNLALANFIYVLNNNFGAPFSWQTVLLISVLAFAVSAYLTKSVWCAAVGIIGFLVWWAAQAVSWCNGRQISAIYVGLMWLAIFLYAAGFIQTKKDAWRRFAAAYTLIGILLGTVILFVFSTQIGLGILEEITARQQSSYVWQILVSVFAISALSISALAYGGITGMVKREETIVAALFFCLFGFIFIAPPQLPFSGGGTMSAAGIAWAAIFNFALVAEILGIIFSGYARRELWLINLGAIFLVLFVAVKYFDWFFEFLDKSVFFLCAGALLFVVGYSMEKGRRYLASAINQRQTGR